MKTMMAITIVSPITCLFLVSVICFKPSPQYVMFEEKMRWMGWKKKKDCELETQSFCKVTQSLTKKPKTLLKKLQKTHIDRVVRRKDAAQQATGAAVALKKFAQDTYSILGKKLKSKMVNRSLFFNISVISVSIIDEE